MSLRGIKGVTRARAVTGAVGAAVLVMGALVVAASSGPADLVSRPSAPVRSPLPTLSPEQTLTDLPREAGSEEGVGGWDPDSLFAVLLQVFVVLVIIAVLVLFGLALRDLLRRVTPRLTTEAEPDFPAPDVPRGILDGADTGLEALERGAPRNAIVAAWVALELAATGAGLPRHPAETSTEYVERVLQVWAVDARDLGELAALYREARFSTHPLTETHRRRAVSALTSIRADLGRAPQGTDLAEPEPTRAHSRPPEGGRP